MCVFGLECVVDLCVEILEELGEDCFGLELFEEEGLSVDFLKLFEEEDFNGGLGVVLLVVFEGFLESGDNS